MKTWVVRGLLAALVIGLAIWAWKTFFPGPEQQIRKVLNRVGLLGSFGTEGPLARVANNEQLLSLFTKDVELVVDVPGRQQYVVSGIEELRQGTMAARSTLSALKIEFLDVHVRVGASREQATVGSTLRAQISGEKDPYIQEIRITFNKIGGDWLISRIQTVRTLE